MSIINEVRNYINPAADQEDSVFRSNEIHLVSDVINTHDDYPLTGSYAEDRVRGWSWSRTFPQDLNDISSRIETKIDANTSSYEEGSKLENWQGCVLSNIELRGVEEKYEALRSKWVPRHHVGEYSLYHKTKRLYSDYSLCANLIEVVVDEIGDIVSENQFNGFIKNISIAIYKRDRRFVNFPFYKYIFDESLIENNAYRVIFDVDAETSTIEINELKSHPVGGNFDLINEYPDILNTWEYAGRGYDTRSKIYTEYFPVKEGSLELVEVYTDAAGERTLKTWEAVSEFTFNERPEYILDKTNGIITINSIAPEISQALSICCSLAEGFASKRFSLILSENSMCSWKT